VSACLQVIEDTGELTSKHFTLTNKWSGKCGGNLTMAPILASALVVGKGKEGSDGSLESSKIRTADTGIKARCERSRSAACKLLCALAR
jgi:hypothetical protein